MTRATPSKAPFAAALVMLAVAFAGIFVLAKTGPQTHALENDGTCAVALSPALQSMPGEGACAIAGGKIATVKRGARGVPYVGFAADDGHYAEIAFVDASDADVANLQRDVGTAAALRIVFGTPAALATKSGTFVLDRGSRPLHYAGVALVASALAYFGAWIAVSILARRRAAMGSPPLRGTRAP